MSMLCIKFINGQPRYYVGFEDQTFGYLNSKIDRYVQTIQPDKTDIRLNPLHMRFGGYIIPYMLRHINMDNTGNYLMLDYKGDADESKIIPLLDIKMIEFDQYEDIDVAITGFIDPFWVLFIQKIRFQLSDKYKVEVNFSDIKLRDCLQSVVTVSKRIGNRIAVAHKDDCFIIKTLYDGRDEFFAEHLREEAEMIKTERKRIYDMNNPAPVKKKPVPDTPTEKSCRLSHKELDYWELVDSIPKEERSYYGWEHDPQ